MFASRLFARSLATSSKVVKPPIQLFGVDGTYANALYSASVKESSVDKTFQALTRVNELFEKDAKVREIFLSPALTKDDRTTVTKTIASSLKLDGTTSNFLNALAENNRLSDLQAIYKNFSKLTDAHNGVVEARITSVKPLDSKILKRLQTAITKSSFVGPEKTLRVTNDVNPEILGGLVVEVGDKTADLSIASKVSKLNNSLKEAL